MNVIKLTEQHLEDFKAYCMKYRYAHDESYLYEEDMEEINFEGMYPTYLLMKDDVIIGVLSFMLDEYFIAGKKSRIRIFHCESADPEHYQRLYDAMDPLEPPVETIEMFLPNRAATSQSIMKNMGFNYYRTSYVMVRKGKEMTSGNFPEGYTLKPLIIGQEEEQYAHIRNTAFKSLKGSEAPMSLEAVKKLVTDSYVLKNGIQILWYGDEAVGILRMVLEEDQSGTYSFVAPIALLPEHQGKGLGTELLKAGIAIGQVNGHKNCMLSVNAENEQALSLYKKVGFEVDEAVSCFQLKYHKPSDL